MLLIFKEKGCKNCPFIYNSSNVLGNPILCCSLSERYTADDYRIPLLLPNREEKPKDCPFVQEPCTLEIQAWNE